MKMTLRWYGPDDPVTLKNIRQIPGVTGIVSALYDVPVGDTWPYDKIMRLREKVEQYDLTLDVIESIPVHEDIKLGLQSRNRYIDHYCKSIENMGKAGIPVLCYNFMPIFDWTRTDLEFQLDDGSFALRYDHEGLEKVDLSKGTGDLPGWATAYSAAELKALLKAYQAVDDEKLWENLQYFLKAAIPVAESSSVLMAIHPDDPPWSIFGLPRIITNAENLRRFLKLVESRNNGLTFCTGSLGPAKENDLPAMVKEFAPRIHFAHMRNIKRTGEKDFHESGHPTRFGDVDMRAVVQAYNKAGFTGPMRPDHGRMIWGEQGRPGYGLYDRALGAMYLSGLWEGLK